MFLVVLIVVAQLLPAQPADPAELSQKARQAMSAGRYAEAVGIYRQLTTQLPNVGGLRLNLGLALFQQGKHRPALTELQTALKLDPSLTPAAMLAGLCHAKLGEPLLAIPLLEKARAAEPANPVVLLELADANYAAGRYVPAIQYFQELTQRQPMNPTAWRGLGLSLTDHSQLLFTKLQPGSAEALTLLARAKLAADEPKATFTLLRQALGRDAAFGPAHGYLSELYRKTGHTDWASAEQAKSGPGTGVFAEIIDASDRALEAFARLAALGPSPELYETEAEAAQARGAYPDAEQSWRKALELKPGAPNLERGLAKALFQGREYAAALPLLTKYGMSYETGAALLETGKAAEAVPHLAKVRTPEAQAALGRAYLALDQPAKAVPALRAGLAADRDGSVHFQLARALQRTGAAAQAQEMDRISQQLRRAQAEQQDAVNAVQITPP